MNNPTPNTPLTRDQEQARTLYAYETSLLSLQNRLVAEMDCHTYAAIMISIHQLKRQIAQLRINQLR